MSDAADNPPPPAAPPTAPAPPARNENERRIVVIVLLGIVAFALSRGALHSENLWFFAVAIPSIILHEVAHGVVANAFGDDTAKRAGRLTLNPIAHIDLFGTLLMPFMLVMAGVTPFGYAKPVPVNVGRLRSPRNHSFFVGLAGPATNIVLATIAVFLFRSVQPERDTTAFEIIVGFGFVNVLLATFNLLPIPPLDGSAFIERVLPQSLWPTYLKIRRYSMPILIIIIFGFPDVFAKIYDPMIDLWVRAAT